MSDSDWIDQPTGLEIAIVGMAGRFPQASDLNAFWHNLRSGVEAIMTFSDEELAAAGVSETLRGNPAYVRSGAVLDNADLFDAAFFGYYPREAQILDPQQRIFLECAWAALENAGYAPGAPHRSIGVFGSASSSGYLQMLLSSPEILANTDVFQLTFANEKDYLATRVAYKLGLEGPSFTVQTACSSSLVAVHLACQSLIGGECDLALAGGVSIAIPQRTGYLPVAGGILSPDGHCRAFDARAQGTFRGEGAGIVVLRRLSDALESGDTIYAVIKGSAINNDGNRKIGFTAPSLEGQMRAIQAAHIAAEITPDDISYVEAHGTATTLGDPIEVAALTRAFRSATSRRGFCRIGSVKTNIGHLDAAAGVAGLIKTVLALYHRQIPPSLHFEQPNPEIDLAGSPFRVNAALTAWEADGAPRRAGVSSFGVGGTNAHLVLEEAPPLVPGDAGRSQQLLLLSAKSTSALKQMAAQLAAHLQAHPEQPLADVAYTLHAGRALFEHRLALVVGNGEEAAAILQGALTDRQIHGAAQLPDRPLVFMFPGGGAQYANMARGLYEQEPVFRRQIDQCAVLLLPHLGSDIRSALFPGSSAADCNAIHQSALFPAAMFAVEYALAQLLMSWGIKPQAMIGHSLGEYVAACLAGVFALEDALALVALRGRLFERLPPGAMLSVSLSATELEPLLHAHESGLCISVINAPDVCVVSGTVSAIEALAQRLSERNHDFQRLHLNIAAHSPAIDLIQADFLHFLRSCRLHAPRIPFVSNISGTWITEQQAIDPCYWADHLRRPVRFADGIAELLQDSSRIFVEVGPGWTLSSAVRLQRKQGFTPLSVTSMRHVQDEQPDLVCLLHLIGRLWAAGVAIDAQALYAGQSRRRVPLPSYPFERQRYWVETDLRLNAARLPGGFEPPLALDSRSLPVVELPDDVPAENMPQGEIEQRLATIWQDLFGISRIDRYANFFELGGHSLLATRLLFRVNAEFGTDLLLKTLLLAPSIAQLAAAIAADQQGTSAPLERRIDVEHEAELDDRIVPPARQLVGVLSAGVFLTGATGYLGAYLLSELLEQTAAPIYCLVRAADEAEGYERIRRNLDRYRLWNDQHARRVVPILGNLEQPLLGMSVDRFGWLSRQIGAIYHCGAHVHFTLPYESLKASNVAGTHEVLRLAVSERLKLLHFVSTTAVFPASNSGLIGEDAVPGDINTLSTGYAQSKWIAEHLINTARARGIPIAVYRPGAVTGDTRTGICRVDDAVWRLLKSCVQLGSAPITNECISSAPVDYVSRALVAISLQSDVEGKNFHLTAPESIPWRSMFAAMRELGYALGELSYAEWRAALLSASSDQENALFPLIHLLDPAAPVQEQQFDCRNTRQALAHSDIACAPLDAALLRQYVDYFVSIGFLDPGSDRT
jgi:phthiocerol/phenolphthiocerol synthesis type-I polyketide synthase E